MMDFRADTNLTAKAYMLIDQQRTFVECDLARDDLSAVELDLLLAFASQLLGPSSATTEDEEVRATPRVFEKRMLVVLARRRATVW